MNDKLSVKEDVLSGSGAGTLLLGETGSGKTTLIHSTIQYIMNNWEGEKGEYYSKEYPVKVQIFGPKNVIKNDIENYDKFPTFSKVHKHGISKHQAITKNRLDLSHECDGSVIVIDDLTEFNITKRKWESTIRNINSILTTERHIGACMMMSIHTTRLPNGDIERLADLSKLYVFLRKYGAGKMFHGRIPNGVKEKLNKLKRKKKRNPKKRYYFVVDEEQGKMSQIVETTNPKPLLKGMGGLLDDDTDGANMEAVSSKEIIRNNMDMNSDKLADKAGIEVGTVESYKSQIRGENGGKITAKSKLKEFIENYAGDSVEKDDVLKEVCQCEELNNPDFGTLLSYWSNLKRSGYLDKVGWKDD